MEKLLEEEYAKNRFCDSDRLDALVAKLGINENKIRYWFKKKRENERNMVNNASITVEDNGKRPKVFTEAQKSILIRFHDSVCPIPQPQHFPELCKSTNLTVSQIRNWLNQYRRKLVGKHLQTMKLKKTGIKYMDSSDEDEEEDVEESSDEEFMDSKRSVQKTEPRLKLSYKPSKIPTIRAQEKEVERARRSKPRSLMPRESQDEDSHNEDSEDEEEITPEAETLLIAQYKLGSYCQGKPMLDLLAQTQLSKKTISTWFRKRRSRAVEETLLNFYNKNPNPTHRDCVFLMTMTKMDSVNKVENWFEMKRRENHKRPVGRPRKNRHEDSSAATTSANTSSNSTPTPTDSVHAAFSSSFSINRYSSRRRQSHTQEPESSAARPSTVHVLFSDNKEQTNNAQETPSKTIKNSGDGQSTSLNVHATSVINQVRQDAISRRRMETTSVAVDNKETASSSASRQSVTQEFEPSAAPHPIVPVLFPEPKKQTNETQDTSPKTSKNSVDGQNASSNINSTSVANQVKQDVISRKRKETTSAAVDNHEPASSSTTRQSFAQLSESSAAPHPIGHVHKKQTNDAQDASIETVNHSDIQKKVSSNVVAQEEPTTIPLKISTVNATSPNSFEGPTTRQKQKAVETSAMSPVTKKSRMETPPTTTVPNSSSKLVEPSSSFGSPVTRKRQRELTEASLTNNQTQNMLTPTAIGSSTSGESPYSPRDKTVFSQPVSSLKGIKSNILTTETEATSSGLSTPQRTSDRPKTRQQSSSAEKKTPAPPKTSENSADGQSAPSNVNVTSVTHQVKQDAISRKRKETTSVAVDNNEPASSSTPQQSLVQETDSSAASHTEPAHSGPVTRGLVREQAMSTRSQKKVESGADAAVSCKAVSVAQTSSDSNSILLEKNPEIKNQATEKVASTATKKDIVNSDAQVDASKRTEPSTSSSQSAVDSQPVAVKQTTDSRDLTSTLSPPSTVSAPGSSSSVPKHPRYEPSCSDPNSRHKRDNFLGIVKINRPLRGEVRKYGLPPQPAVIFASELFGETETDEVAPLLSSSASQRLTPEELQAIKQEVLEKPVPEINEHAESSSIINSNIASSSNVLSDGPLSTVSTKKTNDRSEQQPTVDKTTKQQSTGINKTATSSLETSKDATPAKPAASPIQEQVSEEKTPSTSTAPVQESAISTSTISAGTGLKKKKKKKKLIKKIGEGLIKKKIKKTVVSTKKVVETVGSPKLSKAASQEVSSKQASSNVPTLSTATTSSALSKQKTTSSQMESNSESSSSSRSESPLRSKQSVQSTSLLSQSTETQQTGSQSTRPTQSPKSTKPTRPVRAAAIAAAARVAATAGITGTPAVKPTVSVQPVQTTAPDGPAQRVQQGTHQVEQGEQLVYQFDGTVFTLVRAPPNVDAPLQIYPNDPAPNFRRN